MDGGSEPNPNRPALPVPAQSSGQGAAGQSRVRAIVTSPSDAILFSTVPNPAQFPASTPVQFADLQLTSLCVPGAAFCYSANLLVPCYLGASSPHPSRVRRG